MKDVSFETKLTWFASEPDEAECTECGRSFEVTKGHRKTKFCPDCRKQKDGERSLAYYYDVKRIASVTRDPVMDLVFAVCKQATIDSNNGDRDAKQWLVTDMELWLRACGLSLRSSERERIRRAV